MRSLGCTRYGGYFLSTSPLLADDSSLYFLDLVQSICVIFASANSRQVPYENHLWPLRFWNAWHVFLACACYCCAGIDYESIRTSITSSAHLRYGLAEPLWPPFVITSHFPTPKAGDKTWQCKLASIAKLLHSRSTRLSSILSCLNRVYFGYLGRHGRFNRGALHDW